jgi:hypothetical protein
MEVAQAEKLSPEAMLFQEFDTLLATFEAQKADSQLDREEIRLRDEAIFSALKQTLQTAEGMANIQLVQQMNERLAEMACQDDHFAQQLDNHSISGNHENDEGAETRQGATGKSGTRSFVATGNAQRHARSPERVRAHLADLIRRLGIIPPPSIQFFKPVSLPHWFVA